VPAQPQKEHEWLHRLVGEWTYEHSCDMGPGQPPMKAVGTEIVRSLGGLWVVGEGKGEMPGGGPATMILTLGYDPQRKRYVGTWIGSMMTHLWVYDGSLDAAEKVLTLNTVGPGFTAEGLPDGTTANYRDVIEILSREERTLTSHLQGPDGQWTVFMTARYRRTK
jgi:hypothetical protein